MEKSSTAPKSTPSFLNEDSTSASPTGSRRTAFFGMAANMSWQLALVVLVPVIGGAQLDKAMDSSPLWVLVGIGLAVVLSGVVMWRTVKIANSLPVPKLSDAQKRDIQKGYEEDDD